MRAIVVWVALLCIVPVAGQAQARPWMQDRPCGTRLTQAPSHPAPETGRGCTCATTADGAVICQCLSDSTRVITVQFSSGERDTLLVDRPSDPRWDTLQVLTGDLDGDGGTEFIIPVFEIASNGMGVGYWRVLAFTQQGNTWAGDTVRVEDYNTRGSWVARSRGKGCDLLDTHWIEGSRPGGDGALYLEARWRSFRDGRFSMRVDRPVLRRRYTFAFQRERGRTADTTGPLSWLLSPQAHP